MNDDDSLARRNNDRRDNQEQQHASGGNEIEMTEISPFLIPTPAELAAQVGQASTGEFVEVTTNATAESRQILDSGIMPSYFVSKFQAMLSVCGLSRLRIPFVLLLLTMILSVCIMIFNFVFQPTRKPFNQHVTPIYEPTTGSSVRKPSTPTMPDGGADLSMDRVSLNQIYIATDGVNWRRNEGWLSEEPICNWVHVHCNHAKDGVSRLDLDDNALDGTISKEIGLMKGLTELILSHNNNLRGSIPSELGELIQLQKFQARTTHLTGRIPTELGVLIQLKHFDLTESAISGIIPTELGRLEQLEYFDLVSSNVSGTIPSEIGKLTALKKLTLSNALLKGVIPSEVGQLKDLINLSLSNVTVSGTIPTELGLLENLDFLDFKLSPVSGTIPTEFGQLDRLRRLDLSSTKLSGNIPSELGRLRLRSLLLGNTNLSGTIPSELKLLGLDLMDLDLTNTSLSGSIPTEFGLLETLESLDLSYTKLTGTIPTELGELKRIRKLFLHGTNLYGNLNSIFCSSMNTYEHRSFDTFVADCGGKSPHRVICDCCTHCCDPSSVTACNFD